MKCLCGRGNHPKAILKGSSSEKAMIGTFGSNRLCICVSGGHIAGNSQPGLEAGVGIAHTGEPGSERNQAEESL